VPEDQRDPALNIWSHGHTRVLQLANLFYHRGEIS
jgi:hypothetical protein